MSKEIEQEISNILNMLNNDGRVYNCDEALKDILELFTNQSPKEEQPEKIVRELPSPLKVHNAVIELRQELKDKGKDENFADINSWIMGANYMEEHAQPIITRQSKEIVELKSEVEKAKELIQMYLDFCLIHSGEFDKKYGEMSEEDIQNKFTEFLEGTKTK